MQIKPFIQDGAFGPEETAAMAEAFEAACQALGEIGQFEGLRELIALRIIADARGGELDPVRLRTAALSGLLAAENSPEHQLIAFMAVRGAAQH